MNGYDIRICRTCGRSDDVRKHTKGSFAIEVGLWILCFPAGIIYSIWRLTTRGKVCGKCGSAELVPVDSPIGRELLAKYGMRMETGAPDPAFRQSHAAAPIPKTKPGDMKIYGAK